MVNFECQRCNYNTPIKCNYEKHLKTKKHLKKMSEILEDSKKCGKNVEKCGKNVERNIKSITNQNQNELILFEKSPQNLCILCGKNFSRSDSLKRHLSLCNLNNNLLGVHKYPQVSKNVEKSINFTCQFCQNQYQTNRGLSKHVRNCLLRKHSFESKILETKYQAQIETSQAIIKEQQKTIETVKQMKPSITNITHNNSTNKTINYLNTQYGEMIAMEKFLHNLQYEEQLTTEECRKLLTSYKDSGIELFARSFSHVMKENCRRQLLKEGLPEMDIIPLYCSDGNLRSHKEKNSKGWKTKYDNQSLNTMINISSEQVYENCQKPLMIFGKERNKVFKQLKQDNHSQNKQEQKLIEDN